MLILLRQHPSFALADKTEGTEFLAFTQSQNVWRIPLANESVGTQLLSNISADGGSIVADCAEHKLYWNSMADGIRRSRYDGSDNQLVLPQKEIYLGLAIDFISRNIFWRKGNSLFVARLKDLPSGQLTVMTDSRLTVDSALAVHPARGMIYWSGSTGANGRSTIQATSMNGSNDAVLVEGVWVLSLTIDFETDRLYWADHGTGNLESVSLDGGLRRIYAQGANGKQVYGITSSKSRIFWTSLRTNSVNSVTKTGLNFKRHNLPPERHGVIFGIALAAFQCPAITNACAIANGGCPFICLPLPGGVKRCVCPEGNDTCHSGAPVTMDAPGGNPQQTVPWPIGSIIGGVLLLAVAIAVVVFVLVRRRKVQKRKALRERYEDENASNGFALDYLAITAGAGPWDAKLNSACLQYTKMLEIPLAKVEISTEVLGKGEFGVVFKSLAHDLPSRAAKKATTVAAKTLIGSVTPQQTQTFMEEFKIMLECGHHVNIVNILGVVLEGPRPFLLLEFCDSGSLFSYLKRHGLSPQPTYEAGNGPFAGSPVGLSIGPGKQPKMSNPYCTEASVTGPAGLLLQDSLSSDDLVQFCYQVSSGMEHLTSRFIIHRDLAARNVLVSEKKILKISDFGLARTGETYMVSDARVALPVLWMPPEAIVSRHFSQKSDVWSFGVLMWEIFSMGAVPFDRPDVEKFSTAAFADWLLLGNQMSPPEHCPLAMCETMRNCWTLEVEDRPTFTEIRTRLDGFVCKNGSSSNPYLNLTGIDSNPFDNFEELDQEILSCLKIQPADAWSPAEYPSYVSAF
ncbi:putative Fibroblast growth factor receptor-like protein 2 [Hypsibius exemplaris]|uniref:receptor protein-tyrosine kinase n=1 Tax=Hypsibius exemplaris TaxID=2072580 RepID=A0A1W0WJW0_HYPEX|nr:putative Fibroblast growth factor receptor-like protein 2 [Hypsibius exemplaris]